MFAMWEFDFSKWNKPTLTPIAERAAVQLSIHVLTTKVCRGWDSNTQHSACDANALTHCATVAVSIDQNSLPISIYNLKVCNGCLSMSLLTPVNHKNRVCLPLCTQ